MTSSFDRSQPHPTSVQVITLMLMAPRYRVGMAPATKTWPLLLLIACSFAFAVVALVMANP